MNYPGDSAFEKLLKKTGCEMTCIEVRAFLMGCILSEEFVSPNHALEIVLGGDEDDRDPFKNEKEAAIFMSAFMGLWNEMADLQFSKKPFCFSKLPKSFSSDKDFKISIACRVSEMCAFMDGILQEGGDDGYDFDPTDIESLSLTGLVDISIQSIGGQLEDMIAADDIDQEILLSIVDAVDMRIEKALKKYLIEHGKGPLKTSTKPKKASRRH